MSRSSLCGATLVALSVSTSARAQEVLSFAQSTIVSGIEGARAVKAADLDGDGDQDLVVATSAYPGIVWCENLGTQPPTFTVRTVTTARPSTSAKVRAISLFIADVDGDGDKDFGYAGQWIDWAEEDEFAIWFNTFGAVEWYENLGGSPAVFAPQMVEEMASNAGGAAGTWTAPAGWPAYGGFMPFAIEAVDNDNDGDIDLAVSTLSPVFGGSSWANPDTGILRYVNNGVDNPTWTVEAVEHPITSDSTANPPVSLVTANMDNAGGPEIIHLDADVENPGEKFVVHRGAVRSEFDTPTSMPFDATYTNQYVPRCSPADFDQDGWTDLAIVSGYDGYFLLYCMWHPGSWPVPSGPAQSSFTSSFPWFGNLLAPSALLAGNLSNDAYPEIVMLSADELAKSVMLVQNSAGVLNITPNPAICDSAAGARGLDFVDLTGDGLKDIVVGAAGLDAIVMLRQGRVRNTNTNAVFTSLASAIGAASNGHRLVFDEGRTRVEPTVSLGAKSVRLASDGDFVQVASGALSLPNGAGIEAATGGAIALHGSTTIATSAVATFTAASATVSAEGTLTLNSGSRIDTGASVRVFGALTLGTNAVIDSTTPAEVLLNSVPVLTPRLVTSGSPRGGREAWFSDLGSNGVPEVVATTSDGWTEINQYPGNDVSPWTHRGSVNLTTMVEPVDLDGNGTVDLIGASGTTVWWYRGVGTDGLGNFTWSPLSIGTMPVGARSMDVGDIDGDGDLDIAILTDRDRAVRWFQNNANTSFTLRVVFDDVNPIKSESVAGDLNDIRIADIEADGDADLIVASNSDIRVHISNGAPLPSFTHRFIAGLDWTSYGAPAGDPAGGLPPTLDVTSGYKSGFFNAKPRVEPGDIDGDGDLDLVASWPRDHRLVWYENDGAPIPTWTERLLSSTQGQIFNIRVVDVDQDRDLDVLSVTAPPSLWWCENLGGTAPDFEPHLLALGDRDPSLTSELTTSVHARDINGDGDLELLESFDNSDSEGFPGASTGGTRWFTNTARTTTLPLGSRVEAAGPVRLGRGLFTATGATLASNFQEVVIDTIARLSGTPTITGHLCNEGSLVPSNGTSLPISGNFAQPGGSTTIDLTAFASGGAATHIDIVGSALLGGGLIATTSVPLNPLAFTSVTVLNAGTIVPGSRFATALLPNVGTGKFLSVVYNEGGARALASVALQVNPLTGDVDLDPAATADSGAGGVPKGATLADIDNDGDPDLLIALPDATNPTTANGSVVILYNADDGIVGNGWEGFGATVQITSGVGINPSSVAVARIDANPQPDIVVSNRGNPSNSAPDTVSVLLVNNPNSVAFSLSATPAIPVGDQPADVIVYDFDQDGAPDIATSNAGDNSVSIGWNSGLGSGGLWGQLDLIDEVDLPTDEDVPVSVRPGDTNASGNSFIATSNSGSNSIGLVRINVDRSTEVLPNIPAGASPVEVVVADFDLDGEDDIASVNRNGSSVTVVLNQTNGGPGLVMGAPTTLPIPTTTGLPRSIAAGDFDSDTSGDIDLAILADGVVKVFRNDFVNGQLAFTLVPDQGAGTSPLLVRSADLNDDGRDDVVTIAESTGVVRGAGRAADSVSTLLAQLAPPACPGDVTGDGNTNISDFNILAGNFGLSVTPFTSGDLSGDGLVNISDFNILAGDFGCGQ